MTRKENQFNYIFGRFRRIANSFQDEKLSQLFTVIASKNFTEVVIYIKVAKEMISSLWLFLLPLWNSPRMPAVNA